MTAGGGGGPGGGDLPDDLPEEVRALLSQLGGSGTLRRIQEAMGRTTGPVNWDLAGQVSLQLAAEGDRSPTPEERERTAEAQQLAEHWLDEGALPAPPDAGRLAVVSRQEWVNAALEGLRPLVEPVAEASIAALSDLVDDQMDDQMDDRLQGDVPGMPEGMPEGIPDLSALFGGETGAGGLGDLSTLLRPMGAVLMGLQAGNVIGQLSRQMLGQYDLGLPTARPAVAYHIPVNVADGLGGYDLDDTELAVTLALHEGAHRRQYHAVPWLSGHLRDLVASFAAGTSIDPRQLLDTSRDLMGDVDPQDPESLRRAVERAGEFRLEPTPEQRRVLERIQGVICLLQAWARREVHEAAADRLPNLERFDEVLRRRRVEQGDGERLLANLLGLDLRPDDETVGDRFIDEVQAARGLAGLRRALAHPENLPDTEELADPSRWLVRMAGGESVPDDPSALFGDGEAPVEPSAEERRRDRQVDDAGGEDGDGEDGDGGDGEDGGDGG